MSSETTWLENEAHLHCLTPDLDRVCDRFEAAWKAALAGAGPRPHVEDYLTPLPEPERKVLLRELMELDFPYRKRHEEVGGRTSPRPAGSNFATPLPSETAPAQPFHPPEVSPTPSPPSPSPGRGGVGERRADPPLTATEWKETKTATSIRCLHCHQPIDLTDNRPEEISCPACGASFRICDAGDAQRPSRALGKFQLLERIGVGAYGTVWKARDTELRRVVALKIPHPVLANYPRELERFHREARAAAQLRHPGIVTVHEVAMLDGLPTIVSDFIDGVTLRELSAQKRLTFRESAALLAEVADALDYAHSMGLVHRDIKPANIMVKTVSGGVVSGKEDTATHRPQPTTHHSPLTTHQAMIMDFGLALRDEAEITMTVDGHIVGTPAYMSPEQAAGKAHEADRRSDVYSLGVIFYELLCGELPFRGSKKFILEQVQKQEPRPPRQVNDKIPRDLETICLKAMAKSPSHRYPSARELADDLRRFLKGEPILARPVSRAEKLLRWCGRNPLLASAGSLAAACLIGFIVLLALFGIHESDAAASIAKEQTKTKAAVATLAFDRGRNLCEQGHIAHGLLWLARGLENAPEEAEDLQHIMRVNLASWSQQLRFPKVTLRDVGIIPAAAFSRDGKTILTVGRGQEELRLWDAATGQAMGPPIPNQSAGGRVVFGPNGDTFLSIVNRTAQVRESLTGKPLSPRFRHEDLIEAGAISTDGKLVLTGSTDRTARLWDVQTGKLIFTFRHQESVRAVAFSPDNKTILTGSADKTARLWDANTGKALCPPLKHQGGIDAAAFSPDGKTVLTGSVDKIARLWDAATGDLLTPLFLHQAQLSAVAFSPDGKTILTGGNDKTARLWNVMTGKSVGPPLPHQGNVNLVAFSPDGKTILTGGFDETVRLWQASTTKSSRRILRHQGAIQTFAFSPDGKTIVTGSDDNTARLWNTETGKPFGKPLQHGGRVLCLVFSADGKNVLTGSSDGTARLWDASTGEKLREFKGPEDWVWSVALNPDGKTVAAAGAQHDTVHLWETATGQELAPLRGHLDGVTSVVYSADGKTILTGSADSTAILWEASTGKVLRQFTGHQGILKAAIFSSDEKKILTYGSDHTARIWDAASGNLLAPALNHRDGIWVAEFSRDGASVLTGSADNTAQLWDVATGKPIGPALQHQDEVLAVAFSPDGKTLLTGSKDMTAQVWDARTGQPIGSPFQHQAVVHDAAFSPDGKTILIGGGNIARLWPPPPYLEGDLQRIVLWTQVLSRMELESGDAVRQLDGHELARRRQRLESLGGLSFP